MKQPFFIAEIGINHMGDMDKARRMVVKAATIGASAVKFQKYDPIKLLGADSPYLKDAHQLSWEELRELSLLAWAHDLQFGCSVFALDDILQVDEFSDFHKIASRMNQDRAFIRKIAQRAKPTYMSIQQHYQVLPTYRFDYMWCVTKYPSTPEETLDRVFSDQIGLSSHCPDWTVLSHAFEMGARVFEAHVCESKDDKGCDIPASLTFEEYGRAIQSIKNHSAVLGSH